MRRLGWIVLGLVIAACVVGVVLNEHGPFLPHALMSYPRFIEDLGARRVEGITQWRTQLEVKESAGTFLVQVPPNVDLTADVRAVRASGVGISWATVPDLWVVLYTPWLAGLILLVGGLLWTAALLHRRRGGTLDLPGKGRRLAGG